MIKVALIDVLDVANSNDRENIGLATIASHLRRYDIDVDLLSFVLRNENGEGDELPFPAYDLYGFSFYDNTALDVLRYVTQIKQVFPESVVCIGGRLASDACQKILADCPQLDFVVKGEGEIPLQMVVEALSQGKGIDTIPGVVTQNSLPLNSSTPVLDLAQLPWPARDYLPQSVQQGNLTARINTSYSCIASCSFCSVYSYHSSGKKRWKGRDIVDVFDEIVWLYQTFGMRSFLFNDASFEDPGKIGKKRIAKFCQLVLESGYQFAFRCSMRAESFTEADGDLLALMRSAGFAQTFIGLEAGNNDDLMVFNKRATVTDNERVLRLFELADIDVIKGFIMFNPFSTLARVRQNYQFLTRHQAYRLYLFTRKIDVYYGTPLHNQLLQAGVLDPNFSYHNSCAYRFEDPDVQALDTFLDKIKDDQELLTIDGKMYGLTYAMNDLRALYGEKAEPFYAKFNQIRFTFAELLADYFKVLLDDFDLVEAERRFPQFRANLVHLFTDVQSFNLRLIYNRTFRNYFLLDVKGKGNVLQPVTN